MSKQLLAAIILLTAVSFFSFQAGRIKGDKQGVKRTIESYEKSVVKQLKKAYACAPQCKPLTYAEREELCAKEARERGEDPELCYE